MRKRLFAVLGSLLLATTTIVVVDSPAQAAPCAPGNGYINGWGSSNTCAQWQWSIVYNVVGVGKCTNLNATQTTYVWNNSNSLYWAYTGSGCTGTHGPWYAKTAGPMAGVFYKNIRSVQRKS